MKIICQDSLNQQTKQYEEKKEIYSNIMKEITITKLELIGNMLSDNHKSNLKRDLNQSVLLNSIAQTTTSLSLLIAEGQIAIEVVKKNVIDQVALKSQLNQEEACWILASNKKQHLVVDGRNRLIYMFVSLKKSTFNTLYSLVIPSFFLIQFILQKMSKKLQIFEYKEDINGKVPVVFSWSFDYNYLCCGGDKSIVYIIDKEKTERHTTSNNFHKYLFQMPKQRYEPFKSKKPLEERRRMLKKRLDAHPNCIAIVLDSYAFSRTCLGKSQLYIVNVNTSTTEIIRNLQEKLKLNMNEILYIFHGKILINWNLSLKEIYEKYKDPEDEYLYLQYGLMECVS